MESFYGFSTLNPEVPFDESNAAALYQLSFASMITIKNITKKTRTAITGKDTLYLLNFILYLIANLNEHS